MIRKLKYKFGIFLAIFLECWIGARFKKPLNMIFRYIVAPLFFLYWNRIAKKLTQKRDKQKKPRLAWGTVPIISNKYWSNAMKEEGYKSHSIVPTFFASINKKEDFDIYYFKDIKYTGLKRYFNTIALLFGKQMQILLLLDELIKNYDILHISYAGGVLRDTPYWNKEMKVMQNSGMKVVVLPFGGDFYRCSHILDKSWLHGMLTHYPNMALVEYDIAEKLKYYSLSANSIVCGFQIDGIGRWDVLPYAIYPINDSSWTPKENYSTHDGTNGVVKILHTPNHRTLKGTEYVINAVKELQAEGLQIELILLEKVQNDEVKRIMKEEADILVEQLLISYALSAIEGLTTGIPVLSNLDNEIYTRVFRRYSYLNECPILSTTPENIKENLRILIKNPTLREELGRAGRKYAVKYHGYGSVKYMFNRIYDKIWYDKEVDLMNMYHPLNPDAYNNKTPTVTHPLIENKLPNDVYKKLNL